MLAIGSERKSDQLPRTGFGCLLGNDCGRHGRHGGDFCFVVTHDESSNGPNVRRLMPRRRNARRSSRSQANAARRPGSHERIIVVRGRVPMGGSEPDELVLSITDRLGWSSAKCAAMRSAVCAA